MQHLGQIVNRSHLASRAGRRVTAMLINISFVNV